MQSRDIYKSQSQCDTPCPSSCRRPWPRAAPRQQLPCPLVRHGAVACVPPAKCEPGVSLICSNQAQAEGLSHAHQSLCGTVPRPSSYSSPTKPLNCCCCHPAVQWLRLSCGSCSSAINIDIAAILQRGRSFSRQLFLGKVVACDVGHWKVQLQQVCEPCFAAIVCCDRYRRPLVEAVGMDRVRSEPD